MQKALDYAYRVLGPGPLGPLAVGAGVAVAGVVIAASVILSQGVVVVVSNVNCGVIDLGSVADLVPGVQFPGKIANGEEGTVRVPSAFVGDLNIEGDLISVGAFGKSFQVVARAMDVEGSSWNGTPPFRVGTFGTRDHRPRKSTGLALPVMSLTCLGLATTVLSTYPTPRKMLPRA